MRHRFFFYEIKGLGTTNISQNTIISLMRISMRRSSKLKYEKPEKMPLKLVYLYRAVDTLILRLNCGN